MTFLVVPFTQVMDFLITLAPGLRMMGGVDGASSVGLGLGVEVVIGVTFTVGDGVGVALCPADSGPSLSWPSPSPVLGGVAIGLAV